MTPKKRLTKLERDLKKPEEQKIIIQWVKTPLPDGGYIDYREAIQP